MKGEAQPVERMKPHMRDVVAMLREHGATDIVVTQPKHYKVTFVIDGRPMKIGVSSTPRVADHHVAFARQKITRMLNDEP